MLEIIWLLKYLSMATHKLLIYLATFQSHHVTLIFLGYYAPCATDPLWHDYKVPTEIILISVGILWPGQTIAGLAYGALPIFFLEILHKAEPRFAKSLVIICDCHFAMLLLLTMAKFATSRTSNCCVRWLVPIALLNLKIIFTEMEETINHKLRQQQHRTSRLGDKVGPKATAPEPFFQSS